MPILYDKGTRVRVLESSGDKCAGGLGVVVDISDSALFPYTVKVDGEREFRNYRMDEIEKVEKRDPLVGKSVKVLDSESTYFIGKTGKVVEVIDDWEVPYRVHFPGEGHVWFKAHQLEDEAAARNPEVGESLEEKVASPRLDDRVTVVLEGSPYTGKSGVVVEVYDFKEKPYRVEFIVDGWLNAYEYFDAADLELLKVEDMTVARKTPGEFKMGDFVEVDSRATTFFGMRGVVEQVRQFATEKYRVQFFEVDAGRESSCWFSHGELVLLVKPESVPEDTAALYVPGADMVDWSDSVSVPIVVPEAPVKALEDEFVRIRLEDGQVVVESLGTPFDEVRIASGLLHGLIRQWHEREEGANRRTAMDMLDLSGEFGELPGEDQAVVDSVVELLKRRDWI